MPLRFVIFRIITNVTNADGTIVEKYSAVGTFVSTNLDRKTEEIIEDYSKRFSIEKMSKDIKDVCGLGKQQVRTLESNLTCSQILAMNNATIELWA